MPVSKFSRLCLLSVLLPLTAHADSPIPVITVTATRIPTPAQNVPAGVTIITKQEMQARGYTTLVQALNAVPGLGVVQSGGPGGQASVFIRGTNSEDVLVLIDGVPANDPADPNGAFNFGEDILPDIARIEIIRGPLAGLYGSNAIGGVINLITVQGSGKPQAEVTVSGGFPLQTKDSATISGSTGPFDYAISAAIDEEQGFDDTARRLAVYAGHLDPTRAKSGAINFGYTPVYGTRVYLVVRARDTDSAYPDLGYPIYDDPDEYGYDTNLFGKLGVKSDLFNGMLTTEAFIARIQDDRYYSNLLDANDPNFATADDHYHGYRTDAQWNNILRLGGFGPAQDGSLQFGVEYINDYAKENVDESGFIETLDNSQHTVSGHLGGQTTLLNRLTLTASMRDDSVSSFGNAFTGRIGGVLAIPEAYLRLKSSYGTGFLAPSLYDLYGKDNFGYNGNPNLKPETSTSYEAGAEFQYSFIDVSATYFDSNIHDLISTTPDFTSEENVGRASINGVETEFLLTPVPWFTADLTYTYTNPVDVDTHTQLERRPKNTGSATLTFSPTPSISIVPEIKYVGPFSDYLYADSGYPTGIGYAEPGTIVDLTGTYKISDKFTVFVQGKNIFGARFEAVNGLQIPGASILFGVRATIQ